VCFTFYVFRGAKRIFAKALQDCGLNPRKPKDSLEKFTPKGYVLFLGVDFESDGAESIEGERRGG